MLNLRKFIEEIRFKNADIPIYVYGETRTSQHIPNDILRELHGFIHMFEDTPEFVARHIIREAKSYLDGLAPPFFKALMDYAQDGSYSWHCPGHSGGVAFLKSPVGQMFHQFFGENMLRADVCNAVEELGQLLDHTGPVAAEREERGAHLQCRPLLLRHQRHQHQQQDGLAPHGGAGRRGGGRPQLPQEHPALDHHDRRGAGVPDAHAQPLRHHRPDPAERVLARGHPRARSPPTRCWRAWTPSTVKPRILTLTQSTYDGVLYNTETIKHALDGYIDTLHFDEAWLPHAAFHTFYGSFHAMGKKRARPKDQLVFATQSTHKLLAGLSQAARCWCRTRRTRKLDRHLFNEAYLMHTSTSPQYAIIASCDVAAAMMEAAGRHRAGGRKHRRGAGLPPRHAQGRQGVRPATGGSRSGARTSWPPRASATADDWVLKAGDKWHGFGDLAAGLQPARPDQEHDHHAGAGRVAASSPRPASRRPSSPSSWPSTAWWSRRPGLYSFFIMFTIGITKGRWNTLLTALQQFKDDYDKNAPMWRMLPEFCAAHPRYERMGLRDLCQSIHEMYAKGDIARLTTEMYLSDLQPAMKPSDAFAHIAHRETERVDIDALEGRITTALLTPYPPGIPLLIPGERFNQQDRRLPALHARVQRGVPGLRHRRARPGRRARADGQRRYCVDCVRQSGAG